MGGAKLALFKAVYLLSKEQDIEHYFAAALPLLARAYQKVGLAPIDGSTYRLPIVSRFEKDGGQQVCSAPAVTRPFVPLYMNVARVEKEIAARRNAGKSLPEPLGPKAVAYIAPSLMGREPIRDNRGEG